MDNSTSNGCGCLGCLVLILLLWIIFIGLGLTVNGHIYTIGPVHF